MDKHQYILSTDKARRNAGLAVANAPDGSRVTVSGPRRSSMQNARLHAMIRDVAQQVQHAGLNLTETDWKVLFADALFRETRMVPNLDSTGYVALGRSTAEMTVAQVADMITLVTAFGDQHGVHFKADDILEASYARQ